MAENLVSRWNVKVTVMALIFQMLFVSAYINRRLMTTWVSAGIPINGTDQIVIPLLRRELTTTATSNTTSSTTSNTTSSTTSNTTSSTTSLSSYISINKARVNWMREYCADHKQEVVKNYPSYGRSGLASYVWMVSPHHHLFYCATPKCASTTWKTYLLEDLKIKWKGDNHAAATRIGIKKQIPLKTTDYMEFFESYRPKNRLAIVRNPWARLVSAYEDKIVHSKWSLKKLCVNGYSYQKNSTVPSFYTLIDCLTSSRRDVIWNAHINPFTSLCGFCYMDYNMIVKLEEMAEAEPFIKESLNFTQRDPHYTPPRKGKYSNTYASYYKNMTSTHIKQLQEIYRDDIELFDYPRTPFE